jgi:hypothetical protein
MQKKRILIKIEKKPEDDMAKKTGPMVLVTLCHALSHSA